MLHVSTLAWQVRFDKASVHEASLWAIYCRVFVLSAAGLPRLRAVADSKSSCTVLDMVKETGACSCAIDLTSGTLTVLKLPYLVGC
jgi:hypothetical protein